MQTYVDQPRDGRSVVPLLDDLSLAWDVPTLMTHGSGNIAVRCGDWRLTYYWDDSEDRLYDIASNPGEYTDHGRDPAFESQCGALRRHLPKTGHNVMRPRFERFGHAFA